MAKAKNTMIIGSIGCILMAAVYVVLGVMGLSSQQFPFGLQVEAFTSTTSGALILFLAAAADLLSVILTQVVYRDYSKIRLISVGTVVAAIAFVALIFVFQQQVLLIAIWVLGAAAAVAPLAACSDIANPKKTEE